MSTLALTFITSMAFVALRAFQQLNVQHDKAWWVVPTSMLMAVCEVTLVTTIVRAGFSAVLPLGLGAGIGCLLAMAFHRWLRVTRAVKPKRTT